MCCFFIKYMSHLLLYYIYCILNMIHLSGRPKDSHRCAECDAIEVFVLWNLITHTHTPIHAGCAGKSLCGGCNLVTTVWECTEVELNKTRFTTTHTHTHSHTLWWLVNGDAEFEEMFPLAFFFFFSLTWPPLPSSFSILLFLFSILPPSSPLPFLPNPSLTPEEKSLTF